MAVPRSPSGAALAALIEHVRRITGVDFSGYKPETLERRAAKRVEQLGLASLVAYVEYVATHPQEAWALQRRFLVSVSSFFRDRPAFEALGRAWRQERNVSADPWRCWVPACATGEEAYTLSMLHAEGVQAGAWARGLEVLATDLELNAQGLAYWLDHRG